ncbi:MAG: CBS domain-containing protein [Deltaproteobacteria bacterium]|nr:CBS domain-containing protein [Deltaproteobacteria bacterium]MBW1794092.1 CBS domain-containing protein [Deltaproteobacteria bacterium]
MKISEVLDKIGDMPYLTISGDCTLNEATEKITGMRQLRSVYVLDKQERLQGTLSLGALIREVIAAQHKPQFSVRSLLTRITSEDVADIMDKHVIYAQRDDDLEKILNRMIHYNIKEIPVVDEDQRIIANVGILDLWRLVER